MTFTQLFQSQSAKSKHPWIDSFNFEPLSQKEVLEGIIADVRKAARDRIRGGGKPVKVVFDLDSTIFDVKPRTLRILKEFARTPEAKKISDDIVRWCSGLEAFQLLYTLEESALANKVPGDEATARTFLKTAFRFWMDRFFSHQYLSVDHATPGAVDFVNRIVDEGAHAVYLTGRDWPGMGRGTRTMLDHCGFPTDPNYTTLLMKPYAGLDDAEFKDESLRQLRIDANVIALFDNEPANFHVFEKNFPEAWQVLYYSNCSTKEARDVKKMYRIDNFLL
jgi:hypothetical protein